ncbi:MAG: heme-binding protein [Clostridiales bacterium]|nr:heme-binding protein [Clostridiales bacterium]
MNEQLINKTVNAIVEEYLRPTDDMTLAAAQTLCAKVRRKAAELGVKAVVAVTNKGGNPVLVECSDGSYIASYDIALNKAYTVVSLKMTTKELSKLASPGGSLYGIQFTNGGKIVIFGGGEPLRNKNGDIIGGLGVSGGSEEQDTALAKYGREIFEKGNR